MSPISRQVYELEKLRTKILEIQTAIDGSIRDHSPTPVVLAMQAEIILIKIHLNEFFDMWADYLLLAGETNTHNNAAIRVVQSYIDSMYSVANNINTITTRTIGSVLNLLKNISAVINGRYDGYSDIVKSLTNLIQIVEARDNPPISRSSLITSHYTTPSSPLPLQPQNARPPPLLQRQNAQTFSQSDLAGLASQELADARGKKYRKIKTKKRRIKSTHKKPLTTNNSRKQRKTKNKKNN